MIKIKVIDLLNKIANGEEVPKKVSINAGIHGVDIWVYDEHYEDYKNGTNIYLLDSGMTTNHLNDEVEIIEEDKKIEKIDIKDKSIKVKGTIFYREKDIEIFQKLSMVINEIIDYLEENK